MKYEITVMTSAVLTIEADAMDPEKAQELVDTDPETRKRAIERLTADGIYVTDCQESEPSENNTILGNP